MQLKVKKKTRALPLRNQVAEQDTWDLTSLFRSDDEWEREFQRFEKLFPKYANFRHQVTETAKTLRACLDFDVRVERMAERLGVYAFLRVSEDQTNTVALRMQGRFQHAATQANEAASFIRPEINALSDAKIQALLKARELAPYRTVIQRIRRYRPHTLSPSEERLLALQGEVAHAPARIFRQLLDADLRFGQVRNEHGVSVELTNANLISFLQSPKRSIRRQAFHQFYNQFQAHENCLTATLAGSVKSDAYHAKVRGYGSSLEAALFPDNVPVAVYHNLIAAVRSRLRTVHHYYEIRRRKMRLREIHQYDTYVPILTQQAVKHDWKSATRKILQALQPLGQEYGEVLSEGLSQRWCDRYPNRGKQSGAFSCGSFDGSPYILVNYQPQVLEDMFTLAHEAGHSMHSYFSARHQPFQYYHYVIFVAEVASTFNEQLLSHFLREHAKNDEQRAYLINREIDSIRGTLIRQTMFAEFEDLIHRQVEQGEPLTVQSVKQTYRELLQDYFGPDVVLDEALSLECLRIPHFYRAFYVYKYATGLSAAIALARRVLQGGAIEREQYLRFLKSGCLKEPLELLRDAGVDMETPEPIEAALDHFASLVDELDHIS